MELKELYQEIILDHAKNPRNKGRCEGYNHDAKAHNPLCGDKVHIYLKLDEEKKVLDLSFEGEGCAISLASASILTETLKGKELMFAKKVTEDFLNMVKTKKKITRSGGCSYKRPWGNISEVEFYEFCLLCMTTVRFEWSIDGELDESKYDEKYKYPV